jgi:hypothetical protein
MLRQLDRVFRQALLTFVADIRLSVLGRHFLLPLIEKDYTIGQMFEVVYRARLTDSLSTLVGESRRIRTNKSEFRVFCGLCGRLQSQHAVREDANV